VSKQTSSKQEKQVNVLALCPTSLANSQTPTDLPTICNGAGAGLPKPERSSHVSQLPEDYCFKGAFPEQAKPQQLFKKKKFMNIIM